jgi:hypothetical protein
MAATFNYKNCKNGAVYYFDYRIRLQWASLLCFEKISGNSFIPSFERIPRQEAYTPQTRVVPPIPQSIAPYRTETSQTRVNRNETSQTRVNLPVAVAVPGGRYFTSDSELSNNETVSINIGSLPANKVNNNTSGSLNNTNRNTNRNTSTSELFSEPSAPSQDKDH